MSRSIHTTYSTVKKLWHQDFASAKVKRDELKKARRQIRKKRRIKRQVKSERRREPAPLDGTPVETIPIEVIDETPFTHHAASPKDIRAVLSALPDSATEGISRIQMCLGKAEMDEHNTEGDNSRDPFTGRLTGIVFPGVFSGAFLGTYFSRTGLICIYAYVYDKSRLPLPRPLCELYLRLQALKTLVHEVAHHHDYTQRMRRGRWLKDKEETVERYAEQMEFKWTNEVVIPYLERAYSKETKALRKWVAHRGGIMMPLEFFGGDCRTTERNGFVRIVFSTSSGFENWVAERAKLPSLTASRLAFAWELHYSDLYDECLKVLDGILATEPTHVAALTCKSDTLVHLGRLDEALMCAKYAVSLSPRNTEALEQRGDVLIDRKEWRALLDCCDSWESLGKLRNNALRIIFMHRAIAHCALADESRMEECLRSYVALSRPADDQTTKSRLYYATRRAYREAAIPLPDRWKALK